MSVADDILFEPVTNFNTSIAATHQGIFDAIIHSLDNLQNYEFSIDPTIPIRVYDRVVDLIETHPVQITYLSRMLTPDPTPSKRPAGALTMKEAFRRIHAGERKFYHCGRSVLSGSRVAEFEFLNLFRIQSQLPYMELKSTGQPSPQNYFEWWAASLVSGYVGYHDHYSFATEDEARKYFHT